MQLHRRFCLHSSPSMLAAALLLAPPVAASAADRVVIFDVQADGVAGPQVTQLPDLMGQLVETHDGLEVVPEGKTHEALSVRAAREPTCADSEACRWRVARDLHARFMLFGSLVKRDWAFVLYLALTETTSDRPAKRTSATLKQLTSLTQAVKVCLDRLFEWKGATRTGPSGSPFSEATRSIETPVVTPEPAVSRSTEKSAPEHSGTQRVMVLDLRTIDVEPAAAAPFASLIAARIAAHPGYDVASADDVHRMMEQQVQKQAGGCTQDDACLVEISRKLSADVIVDGTLGKVGSSYVLTLVILRPADMKSNQRVSETAERVQDSHQGVAGRARYVVPLGQDDPRRVPSGDGKEAVVRRLRSEAHGTLRGDRGESDAGPDDGSEGRRRGLRRQPGRHHGDAAAGVFAHESGV